MLTLKEILSNKKIISLISVALIMVCGFMLYANSLNGQFIWDDHSLVVENEYIRDWSSLRMIFTGDVTAGYGVRSDFYRPFLIFTYLLDYSLWGLNVFGYHLTNTLLHVLVAVVIYWLIFLLFGNNFISLLTSLLFIVHPIHTEAVSYVAGRPESLSALFMLLGIIFYIKLSTRENKSRVLYVAMLLSYLLAILSRENAVILPLLLLLYHYVFAKKIKLRLFIPIIVILFIYILLRGAVFKFNAPVAVSLPVLLARIPGFFVALSDYLRLLLLPLNLHMEYANKFFSFLDPKALFGLVFLFASIIYIFTKAKTNKLALFSICWFFLALLPVANIYPINESYMTEHWLYLPSVGFFLLSAKGLEFLYKKKEFRVPVVIFIIGILAFYSNLTFKQNNYWQEPIAFYKRTLRYAPYSPRVLNNLGNAYRRAGRYEEAVALYKKVIELNSNYPDARYNFNDAREYLDNFQAAITLYKKAIELNPQDTEAYNNLGIAYRRIGRFQDALSAYKKAIEINPSYAQAYNNLAVLYYSQKDYAQAIQNCDKALSLGFRVSPGFLELLAPLRKNK